MLEGHPFERVGGNIAIKVDVRVVAATNRPLEEAVRAGTFRRDLFFRLQVVQLDVPPLRDRLDDVPHPGRPLPEEVRRARPAARSRASPTAALEKLKALPLAGQRPRAAERDRARGGARQSARRLDAADIWLSELDVGAPVVGASRASYKPESLEEVEKRHILETLKHTDWNKSQAAAILGIERSTLDRKIKAYGLAK